MSHQEDEIYTVHEKLGFPTLSEQDLADLLLTNNPDIINKLTPGFQAEFIPGALYRKYVTLSRETFLHYFMESDYFIRRKKVQRENPLLDGDFIQEKKNGTFEVTRQERGEIIEVTRYENKPALVDYLIDQIYFNWKLEDR